MDIVTHAMTGVIAAAPLAAWRPLTAACATFGCVLPDLDVLARLLGKRAFLRCHQTFTHSLPVIAALTLVILAAWHWVGLPEPWAPLALAAGMILHSMMDASNTYGAAIAWPLVRRRFSLGWLFFIDAVTLVVTGLFCAISLHNLRTFDSSPAPAIVFAAFVPAWWTTRLLLARRVRRLAPSDVKGLVPSALLPWRFYGYIMHGKRAELRRLNAFTGRQSPQGECGILDDEFAEQLSSVPEFGLMRQLSAGYHVVSAHADGDSVTVTCRDLRTRNFGGRFGILEVTFDSRGRAERTVFHV
jgi:membrane-bound metal-dependent hydrolase YbcI (DUF457 family)